MKPARDGSRSTWRLRVDTGGTFTDCLAVAPDGTVRRAKVLSSATLRASVTRVDGCDLDVAVDPELPDGFFVGARIRALGTPAGDVPAPRVIAYDAARRRLRLDRTLGVSSTDAIVEIASDEEAPVLAARVVTRTPMGDPLPRLEMRLATTRGTNALLEHRVAKTVLFVTRGFRDLLRIGTQQRPDLFVLDIRRPEPLTESIAEVDERVDAAGTILQPLDVATIDPAARAALARGVRVAAVALLHAWINPEHERRLAERLRGLGFTHVSVSHELAPFIQLLPRAQTTVVDACLNPIVRDYLESIRFSLGDSNLLVMTSAGGLVSAGAFAPKDSLLSGPAGGVVGARAAGRAAGFERIIGFDMGGTSTDVARIDGDFEYQFEHSVAGITLVAPALAIESVAAGGGSICDVQEGRLVVGPRSAGASPGPACYGAGGPLTVTDVNLLLGRLDPASFSVPVDRIAAEEAARGAAGRFASEFGRPTEADVLLEGFLEIANERMAEAIRDVSLRRGYDPRGYALLAFGGAGGQHACAVAERLGIATVVVPPDAGLLSARGLGQAAIERFAERQVLRRLDELGDALTGLLDSLASEALTALGNETVRGPLPTIRRRVAELRFAGQDSVVAVEMGEPARLRAEFEERHQTLFGHCPRDRAVELVSLRVVASAEPSDEVGDAASVTGGVRAGKTVRLRARGAWVDASVHARDALRAGDVVAGPAVVSEAHGATVVEPGWRLRVVASGALVVEAVGATVRLDPAIRDQAIERELFTSRFRAIALEMGETLRRTAVSTNIKERLDFSCAVLDPAGRLVVNAPHIPVHLGALGLCVRELMRTRPIEPGDVWVTNHPGFGGSHLPDVTVITPVHSGDGNLAGFVASRAHHAEIGGATPGSMPPEARRLVDEAVVLAPVRIVRAGRWCGDDVRALLSAAPHPSRCVDDNMADLDAAVAANRRGAAQLIGLVEAHGLSRVHGQMAALADYAADRVRAALRRRGPGRFEALERLDDGWVIRVAITIGDGDATVDFTGTSPVHPGNLNATPAIVQSCVVYVVRLLVAEPLPLNEGLLRPITIVLPECFLNPAFPTDPASAPAVVGGNTETSQRVVDALLSALGLCAGSQGTMNNVTFGTASRSYYETVCGGAGAGPGFAGESGVHTHMTNTRITDPETLEHRYPVRIDEFSLRRGSGGRGTWRGGDGVRRAYRFLDRMMLSIVSQHRTAGPSGLEGGEAGAPGRQCVIRVDGRSFDLPAIGGCEVGPGDRLVLETPGGGGFGTPASSTSFLAAR